MRSISNNDIVSNIVQVCERYGFVRPKIAADLLKKATKDDLDMMDVEMDTEKLSDVAVIDKVTLSI